jgi:hypothetical protein
MKNAFLYIILPLLIVNIIGSLYLLSTKVTEEKFDGGINKFDPCDPNLDSKLKSYLDDRYNYCIQHNNRRYCLEWAPKCPTKM